MVGLTFVLVVISGLIHAIWNLFTKNSINKISFLWQVNLVALLIFLPFLIVERHRFFDFDMLGWAVVSGAALIHGFYFLAMAKAYSLGDLSQVYAIMRGTAAILIPVLAIFLFGESLTPVGWIGLVGIVIGIYVLSNTYGNKQPLNRKALFYSLLVSLCITSYVLVDKLALAYLSPLGLSAVHSIGLFVILLPAVLRSKHIKSEWHANGKYILLGGMLVPGSYLLFLIAMTIGQVAQLAPVREISIVFGTLFGIFLLKEKQGSRRISASMLILAGVVIVGIHG